MTLTYEEYTKHDHRYPRSIIDAEIICDTMDVRATGKRLTTFKLTLPNIIHQEALRHRMFSFSVSSNRAIPVNVVAKNSTFSPVWRYRAKSGMQPGAFVEDERIHRELDELWERNHQCAEDFVRQLKEYGVTKELANRPLAPYQTFTMVVTSSSFASFFSLRDNKDAQHEIQVLARRMKKAYESNTPRYVSDSNQWHLPFVTQEEKDRLSLGDMLMVSAARLARTSYIMPSTSSLSDVDSDIKLAKQLFKHRHMSPLEPVAFPMSIEKIYNRIDLPDGISSEFHRNTAGFVQLRALLEPSKYNPPQFEELRKELREAFEK